jgi:hypothetical protein
MWPWRTFTVIYFTFIGANLVFDLVHFVTWPEFYVLCIAGNVIGLMIVARSNKRMGRLHRDYVARVEGLEQRLTHAIERGDQHDIDLTVMLMRIWNHKPQRPVPLAPDGQDGGGSPF